MKLVNRVKKGINAYVKNDELMKFLRDSKEKEFLFKEDLQEYLEKLYKKGVNLMALGKKIEVESDDDKRSKLIDEQTELLEWFSKQLEISKKLFGEYLRIDKK